MGSAYLPMISGFSGFKTSRYAFDGESSYSTSDANMTTVCTLPKQCCVVVSHHVSGKLFKYDDGVVTEFGNFANSNVVYTVTDGVLKVRHAMSNYTSYYIFVYIIEPE